MSVPYDPSHPFVHIIPREPPPPAHCCVCREKIPCPSSPYAEKHICTDCSGTDSDRRGVSARRSRQMERSEILYHGDRFMDGEW